MPPKGLYKKKKKKGVRSGLRGSASESMIGLDTGQAESISPSPDARNPFVKAETQIG